jgi:hypothetical protein
MSSNTYGLRGGSRPLPRRKLAPLAECIELTAAFMVLGASPLVTDAQGFKRKLLTVPRRDLHGAVAKILAHVPARRFR